jgi:hypothetical protein
MLIFYSSGAHALEFFSLKNGTNEVKPFKANWRGAEEESDAGAPNLPIGTNFENDATN